MLTKSSLAIKLSALKDFQEPKMHLEQYLTPSELAASLLHSAAMQEDIQGKRILDLGCGTGVLGIGACLLEASHVTFLEVDADAISVLEKNLQLVSTPHEVIHAPLRAVDADTVVMNPPFGTKRRHADKQFLLAAMQSAPVIYSIHLAGSEEFLDAVAAKKGFVRTHSWEFSFALPASMPAHTKKRAEVAVVAVRFEQQRL